MSFSFRLNEAKLDANTSILYFVFLNVTYKIILEVCLKISSNELYANGGAAQP